MRIKLPMMIVSIWFISGAVLLPASFRSNTRHSQHRNEVWEPAAEIVPGVSIPGFWRAQSRRGYKWEKAYRDRESRWHPGYWKPINDYSRRDGLMKWVPGYRMGKRWNPGYWRLPERDGFSWIDGYYDRRGRWRAGHWAPVTPD